MRLTWKAQFIRYTSRYPTIDMVAAVDTEPLSRALFSLLAFDTSSIITEIVAATMPKGSARTAGPEPYQ